jgi:ZIP family zinc transporter
VSAVDAAVVFAAALGTALATGLGAIPLAFGRAGAPRRLGVANALASGVMLGASASLLVEGVARGIPGTAVGAVAGAGFVAGARVLLDHDHTRDLGSLRGADARKALLIVAVMTVHSVSEGIGLGASFGGGETLGLVIALAIAVHNIPEGTAISLVLVPRGTRVRTAALWSVFSSLPQPLLAVPAYLFVEEFRSVLPVGLGFAAGAMIWMVAQELLPEALAQAPRRVVVTDAAIAFAFMLGFQTLMLNL